MSVYFKNIVIRLTGVLGNRPLPVVRRFSSTFLQPADNSVKNPALRRSWPGVAAILFLSVLLSVTSVHVEKTFAQDRPDIIIVLDPGHGGNDMGARSSDGITEKQVAMTFAGAMTERLKKTYKVVLTRKDDYQIDVFERSAIANHLKADLFVSIHTGAGFRSHPKGVSLFYYDNPANNVTASDSRASNPTESSSTIQGWEQNRPELVDKSRYLSELVRKRLAQEDQNLKLSTSGAPLIVMSGTDMPAILIEIGTITNPLDAKALNDEAHESNMAQAVCEAIDDFFSNDLRL
jgi:N-acetylmuramoyl-L-alanine amidase